jgi:predicted phosphodiesterase
VISGHTHQPVAGTRRGVLYLDPGSAGPRRFRLPVTVARLRVTEAGLEPETVELRLDDRAADAPTGRAGGRRQRGARRGTG